MTPSSTRACSVIPTTELEHLARLYGQERAALLDGAPDVLARVQALGQVIDSTDDDYTADFQRTDDHVSLTVRPQHPGARPAKLTVALRSQAEADADLREHLDGPSATAPQNRSVYRSRLSNRYGSKGPSCSRETTRRPTWSSTGPPMPLASASRSKSASSIRTTRWPSASKAPSPMPPQDPWVDRSKPRCATNESW